MSQLPPLANLNYAHAGAGLVKLRRTVPRPWLSFTFSYFWLALAVGGFFFGLYMLLGVPVTALCFAMFLVLTPTVEAAVRAGRRRVAFDVISYLDQAVRLNRPFSKLLFAAMHSESGRLARRLADLRSSMVQGASLAQSLRDAVPEIPSYAVQLLQFGESFGRLPQILQYLVQEQMRETRRRRDLAALRWYPLTLICLLSGGLLFYVLIVFPKMDSLLRTAHIELPWFLRWLHQLADNSWILVFGGLPILLLLFGLLSQLKDVFRLPRGPRAFASLREHAIWWVPLLGGMRRDRQLSEMCFAMAEATDAGFAVRSAISGAAALAVGNIWLDRLGRWIDGLDSGLTLDVAAVRANMPRLLSGMLATVRSDSDLPTVFCFVARYYRDRHAVSREFAEGIVLPLTVIAVGTLVLLFTLSVFVPLRDLIFYYSLPFQSQR